MKAFLSHISVPRLREDLSDSSLQMFDIEAADFRFQRVKVARIILEVKNNACIFSFCLLHET
jgi:hypothetical protein